jgi:N-acetylglutamate synthase-like GNAT family acetyltransferase
MRSMNGDERAADKKPAVQVRRIRPAEIDWLCGMDWSPLVKERDTFYLLALAMQGRWALVAEIDGKPAGLVLACVDDTQTRLYVNHLLVAAAHRGAGIGTILMDRVEQEACDAGIRRVWLLTVDARGFYERRGYRVADDVLPQPLQAFVKRVKKTLLMVKDL